MEAAGYTHNYGSLLVSYTCNGLWIGDIKIQAVSMYTKSGRVLSYDIVQSRKCLDIALPLM